MFNRMKLKAYLLTVFSALIVLAGIITLTGVLGLLNTKQNTDQLVNQIMEANSAVKSCRIVANVAGRNLREMVLSENTQDISKFETSIDESIQNIEEQIQIFKNAHGTSDGLAQKYESAFDNWFAIATRVIDEAKQGYWESAKRIILNECSPAMSELSDIAQEIDQTISSERMDQRDTIDTTLRIALVVLVVVFVIALVFGLLVALKTTRAITQTVYKVQSAAEELSKGEL